MTCAVAVLAFALVAAGCGGGDAAVAPVDATTPAPGATDPAAPGAVTGATDPAAAGGVTAPLTSGDAGGGEATPGANDISGADAAVGQTVKVTPLTPKKFRDAHCDDAIMVVYYQPDAIVDEKLLQQATNAAADAGDILMLVYTPKDVKAAGDLPAKLGLFSTPGIATVGRDGKIENFWTTYVDHSLIKRSLLNAKAAKPCKVSAGDVPAAGSALQDAALVASGRSLPASTTADTGAGTADPLTGDPAAASTDPLAGGAGGTDPAAAGSAAGFGAPAA